MRNRIKLLLLAAAGMIALAGLLVAVGVQPPSAAAPVSLPISSYYEMAVDAAHGHIFISQGSSSRNGILVTDLTGQVVTTIPDRAGVRWRGVESCRCRRAGGFSGHGGEVPRAPVQHLRWRGSIAELHGNIDFVFTFDSKVHVEADVISS